MLGQEISLLAHQGHSEIQLKAKRNRIVKRAPQVTIALAIV